MKSTQSVTLSNWFEGGTPNLIRFETIMFLILGVLTIIFPAKMEIGFNYIFAVACFMFGVVSLCEAAFSTEQITPATNWIPFLTAMTAVSVGVVMFIDGMMFIKIFLGVWLFTFGVFQIVRVIKQHKTLAFWGLTLFCGCAALVFSLVMWFDWPMHGVKNVGYFIGPTLIITAITIWYNNHHVFTDAKTSTKKTTTKKTASSTTTAKKS